MARAAIAVIALGLGCSGPTAASDVPPRCPAPADRSTSTLAVTDPVPVIALARGPSDLALVYVARSPFPQLAHFELQRLSLAGTIVGEPVVMSPVDMAIPGTVTVTYDAGAYLACTVAVGGASCFRVDASDGSREDVIVPDAYAIAITRGVGGVIGAWIAGGELNVGPLAGPRTAVATTEAAPSIAPTDSGAVVGYSSESIAYVVLLDASAHPGTPIALGPARSSALVAVAFTAGHVGASFIGPSGVAMASVVVDGAPHTLTIGSGAMSLGHVSITRASDGFFATWSDASGAIDGAFVDLDGAATGIRYSHTVSSGDAAHAVIASSDAFVLATSTNPGASPVDVAVVACP